MVTILYDLEVELMRTAIKRIVGLSLALASFAGLWYFDYGPTSLWSLFLFGGLSLGGIVFVKTFTWGRW